MLTQAQIESSIAQLAERLEDETNLYSKLGDESAEAEADYKLVSAREWVKLADNGVRMTVQERAARVDQVTTDEYRQWKIAEARTRASKEALLSLRSRIDAFRTLAANVRHQT